MVELAAVLDVSWWVNRKNTVTVARTPVAYRAALAPVLRHAKKVQLIDQYSVPYEPRFSHIVRISLELLGKHPHDVLPGNLTIHAGDPPHLSGLPVAKCLGQWQALLQPLVTQYKHTCIVNIWRPRPGEQRHHARYIFTNQYGISVPDGVDCREGGQNDTTVWSLLDHEDWIGRLRHYDPPTSPLDLLGTLTLSPTDPPKAIVLQEIPGLATSSVAT
jgi:hypothetical protein